MPATLEVSLCVYVYLVNGWAVAGEKEDGPGFYENYIL